MRSRAGGVHPHAWRRVHAPFSLATMRPGRAALTLGLVAATVTLCGCQSTQERSAQLRREAKHQVLASQGVSVTKESPSVEVVSTTVLRSGTTTAVVVSLRDISSHALVNAPIEIDVRDAQGKVIFQNNQPGLQPSLTKVSLLQPGQEALWVDDQVQVTGTPVSAIALVGEATQTPSVPKLSVEHTRLAAEAGAEATMSGTVVNHGQVAQQDLVVYAVASRGGEDRGGRTSSAPGSPTRHERPVPDLLRRRSQRRQDLHQRPGHDFLRDNSHRTLGATPHDPEAALTTGPSSPPAARVASVAFAPFEHDSLNHVGNRLTSINRRLQGLEDVLPANHHHRVGSATLEQRCHAVA